MQPFDQIPTYEENGLVLFETGAIILYNAERHGGLLPDDSYARARAISWMESTVHNVGIKVDDALALSSKSISEPLQADAARVRQGWEAASSLRLYRAEH